MFRNELGELGGISAGVAKFASIKIPGFKIGKSGSFVRFTANLVRQAVIGAAVGGGVAEASGGDFEDGARLGAISSGVGFVANQTLTEQDSFTNKTLRTFTRGMKNIVSQIIKSDFGSTAGKVFSRGTTAVKTVFDIGGTLQDSNLSNGEKAAISALQVVGSVTTASASFLGGVHGTTLGAPFGHPEAGVVLATIYGTVVAEGYSQRTIEPLRKYFHSN